MTLLDRYLIKKFLFVLLFGIVAFIIVFLVIDLIENIDKFIDKKASPGIIFLYYVYYIPYIISLTLPVSMLLASLFSLGNMSQHNEIVAQKSAGISQYRIFLPLLLLAFLTSIFAGVFTEVVVPWTNQQRLDIYRYDIKKNPRNLGSNRNNIYIQDSKDQVVSIGFFNSKTNEAQKVSIQFFNGPLLERRVDAKKMRWIDQKWILMQVIERRFQGSTEKIENYEKKHLSFRFPRSWPVIY